MLQSYRSLQVFKVSLLLLEFVLAGFELVLDGPQLSLGDFCISSPLLNLCPQLRLKLQFLLLAILNIMLEFDVFILVLQLPLPVFFMLSPHYDFLLKVFGLQVLPQLIDLPVESVNNLIFALHDVLELNFFRLGLVHFIGPLFHFELHLLVLIDK